MEQNFTSRSTITVDAPVRKVWLALTDTATISKYMMGAKVTSDWKVGSAITWEGEMKGRKYKDQGKVLEVRENKKLVYTHFSPLSGTKDTPENYHIITIVLDEDEKKTNITLTQDHNANAKAKEESEKNWDLMLKGLKKVAEETASGASKEK